MGESLGGRVEIYVEGTAASVLEVLDKGGAECGFARTGGAHDEDAEFGHPAGWKFLICALMIRQDERKERTGFSRRRPE